MSTLTVYASVAEMRNAKGLLIEKNAGYLVFENKSQEVSVYGFGGGCVWLSRGSQVTDTVLAKAINKYTSGNVNGKIGSTYWYSQAAPV